MKNLDNITDKLMNIGMFLISMCIFFICLSLFIGFIFFVFNSDELSAHKTHCLYVKEYKVVQDNGDVLIRKCGVEK